MLGEKHPDTISSMVTLAVMQYRLLARAVDSTTDSVFDGYEATKASGNHAVDLSQKLHRREIECLGTYVLIKGKGLRINSRSF